MLFNVVLAWLPIRTISTLDLVASRTIFPTGMYMSVALHIVDLWQYYVCCKISGDRIHPIHPLYGALPVPLVLWSLIGILVFTCYYFPFSISVNSLVSLIQFVL